LGEGDEIIVVSDVKEDKEMNDVCKWADDTFNFSVKHFCTGNDRYRSCVRAKNFALKNTKNPLIIINDPEVIHITRCIDQIKEHMKKDSRQFIVPGTMRFQLKGYPLMEYTTINHSMAPFIGGVMREELLTINGWDERFVYWGNDDNDLMYRLGLNGCKHICDDNMIALHQYHSRPPIEAMGDFNEPLLYEENKEIIANKEKEWGKG
jgi:hypothetical protein